MMNGQTNPTPFPQLNLNPNPAISGISDNYDTALVFTEEQLRTSFTSNSEEDRNGYREAIRMARAFWSNLHAQQCNFLVQPMVGAILETLKQPLGFEFQELSGKPIEEVDDVARCLVAALSPVYLAETSAPRGHGLNPEDHRMMALDSALKMLEAVIA